MTRTRMTVARGGTRSWPRGRAVGALLLLLLAGACRPSAPAVLAPTGPAVVRVVASTRIPTGTKVGGLEIGGLSALSYDRDADLLYAVVDDAATQPPARVLRFRWHPPAAPVPVDWVELKQADGSPLPTLDADLEGLARRADGSFFISSEGNVHAGIGTWVGRFDAQARLQERLPMPPAFTQGPDHGIHFNQGLEALVLTPDESALIAGNEDPLVQDEPGTPDAPRRCRILRWDLPAGGPPREWLYPVDPVPGKPLVPGGYATAGLTDILPWGDRLLVLERSYVDGRGFGIHLYETALAGAEEVTGRDALARQPVRVLRKRLLADFARLHVPLDNYEGMAWGPPGPDGKPLLMIIVDNNFNRLEQTYLLALSLGEPPPIEP